MRCYQSLPFLASALVAPVFAGPGQDLKAICKSTEGVYGCEEFIKVPFGSEPITTCFDTSPCGVQILTNNRNICDLVEEALPSNANYIGGYTAWCHRAPDALTAIKTDKSVWVDGKLKDAKYVPLARALGIEEEFANQGLAFQNNKASVLANQLANKDGWTVLKGGEITTPKYFDLVERLIAYQTCNSSDCWETSLQRVLDWFMEWIPRGTEIRNGKLFSMLKDWEKTFATPYKNRITAIKNGATTVQTRVKTVSTKVDSIKKSICAKNACTGKTASTYLKNVATTLQAIRDLSNIAASATKADEQRKYIYYNFLSNIQSNFVLPPEYLVPNHLSDLLDDGRLDTLRGIMHGFGTITSELDMYANDIKRSLTPLILLTKHESRCREALKKVNNQLAPNWKTNKELSKTASSRKVRDGFVQIQSLLKKELQGSLTTLINAIDAFDNDFLKFPLRGNKMEVAWGAAPFDRWTNLQFKYPCRKEVTKTFTEEGFSEDFTWSTFSPCTFTAQRVDLPKGWVPYLKYRFVKT
ncbi:hypothetical protein FLAG1_07744 [Fusarium langsethiae]|uniref:Uncharacterized protein n=1 Tax=Fusarium langsethiae TaxID=179993 RepID=A0A0N0DDA1_FUSLA|nr:hypothetical protein FLAG1_07744 [Fusarium langsethiae]GKU06997.1 unnamed protein product [Fusarium langsethiae]GKU22730.1 unnamed protein product [Fusarium langsethiae]